MPQISLRLGVEKADTDAFGDDGGGLRGGGGGGGGARRDRNGDEDEDDDDANHSEPRYLQAASLLTSLVAIARPRRNGDRMRTWSEQNKGAGLSDFREFFRGVRVSYLVLAVNIAMFAAQGMTGMNLLMAGAKVNSAIAAGQWYRLVSPMFLHASISHLAVNSFSLYSTGPSVESWFGKARFVALYITAGIAGNVLSYICSPTPSVGASGAIFGLVGATAVILARHRKILGPRSRRGLNSLAYIVLVNFGMGMSPGSRIDNFGHLGGLMGGVVFAYLAGPRLTVARSSSGKPQLVDVPLLAVALAEMKMRLESLRKLATRRR